MLCAGGKDFSSNTLVFVTPDPVKDCAGSRAYFLCWRQDRNKRLLGAVMRQYASLCRNGWPARSARQHPASIGLAAYRRHGGSPHPLDDDLAPIDAAEPALVVGVFAHDAQRRRRRARALGCRGEAGRRPEQRRQRQHLRPSRFAHAPPAPAHPASDKPVPRVRVPPRAPPRSGISKNSPKLAREFAHYMLNNREPELCVFIGSSRDYSLSINGALRDADQNSRRPLI